MLRRTTQIHVSNAIHMPVLIQKRNGYFGERMTDLTLVLGLGENQEKLTRDVTRQERGLLAVKHVNTLEMV